MNYKVNKFGSSYVSGTSLSPDVRRLVIDKILLKGGDRVTGFFPSTFSKIATDLNITIPSISKIWKQFCDTYDEMPLSPGGDFNKKLDDGDLELIEVLKMDNNKPATSSSFVVSFSLGSGSLEFGAEETILVCVGT